MYISKATPEFECKTNYRDNCADIAFNEMDRQVCSASHGIHSKLFNMGK